MKGIVKELKKLEDILREGEPLGVEIDDSLEKIETVIKSISDGYIRMVLMGSFSDGKTSVIAGLLEKVKQNMKISTSESSDEIAIYRFEGVDNVEIVDTPGLFGTKEKEIDGEIVKYSDITKKYISESNVLVYVCSAVNPLKSSHVPIMRKVLRDFGKLDSTIFVLNKMDEAGVDMLDDADYERSVEIKKGALIDRLRDTVGLTPQEEERIKIVCIAADPKGKGLEYWLEKKEAYRERSRLGLLKAEIDGVVAGSDIDSLKKETGLSVIKDITMQTISQVAALIDPLQASVLTIESQRDDLEVDVANLKQELLDSKRTLKQRLDNYQKNLCSGIDGCSLQTMRSFLETSIGIEGKNVTYIHVITQINQYLSEFNEANRSKLDGATRKFKEKTGEGRKLFESALKSGAKRLGKIKVDNTQVLKTRDFLAKHFKWAQKIKFQPHGAQKLAANITKGLGEATGVVSVFLEIFGFIDDAIKARKLKKLKETLKGGVAFCFRQVYELMNDEETYFMNFAPNYLKMRDLLEEWNQDLGELKKNLLQLQQYRDKLAVWVESIMVDEQ